MSDDLKTYLRELVAEAPNSWRKGQVVMAVVINLAIIALVAVGVQFTNYPMPYFIAGTLAVAMLDVLVILPFKLWKANRTEIASLKNEHQRSKAELWKLRHAGIKLRDTGGKLTEETLVHEWRGQFKAWHRAVLDQTEIYSMDLRHSLDPPDRIATENRRAVRFNGHKHEHHVSLLSEILTRLEKALQQGH